MVTYNKNRRNATLLFTMQIQGTYVEVTGVLDLCTLYAFSGIKEKIIKNTSALCIFITGVHPTY